MTLPACAGEGGAGALTADPLPAFLPRLIAPRGTHLPRPAG